MLPLLKSEDSSIVCKALNILARLAGQWNIVLFLYKNQIVKVTLTEMTNFLAIERYF